MPHRTIRHRQCRYRRQQRQLARRGTKASEGGRNRMLALDPRSRLTVIFRSHRDERLKIQVRNGSGLVLIDKRLKSGSIVWVKAGPEGIDPSSGRIEGMNARSARVQDGAMLLSPTAAGSRRTRTRREPHPAADPRAKERALRRPRRAQPIPSTLRRARRNLPAEGRRPYACSRGASHHRKPSRLMKIIPLNARRSSTRGLPWLFRKNGVSRSIRSSVSRQGSLLTTPSVRGSESRRRESLQQIDGS